MHPTAVEKNEIKLIGIGVRTSYSNEIDPSKGVIPQTVLRYFVHRNYEKIPARKKPGTTICAYTEYESDFKGAYTYFIGEEVSSIDHPLPEGLCTLIIPKQHYAKFTTLPAPMPRVIVEAWKEIWGKSVKELGGRRTYQTDFEVYDERATDPNMSIVDVYIGVFPSMTRDYSPA
jgi:predicted transcriptional regulator YdeE